MKKMGTYAENGTHLTIYQMDGDINTAQGWDKLTLKQATRNFIRDYCRSPVNDLEVLAYNERLCNEIIASCDQEGQDDDGR